MEASVEQEKALQSSSDVIYALRTVHQNQTQQTLMADQKANILVGLIMIISTIILTRFYQLAELGPQFLSSFFLFISFQLVALIFALMVIMPKNIRLARKLKLQDVKNPLFFGNFSLFQEQEFVEHLLFRMNSNQDARELIARDIYHLGLVLKRKFVLLKYAYIFSTIGVIVPAVLFILPKELLG